MHAFSKQAARVRDLAKQVADIAAAPEEDEKARLWTACNDLDPTRPMIFADPQHGWDELLQAWLTTECDDPLWAEVERRLRILLIRHEHIPDDFPIRNTFDVPIVYTGAGYDDYGPRLHVSRTGREDGAYRIEPVIQTADDMRKLHPRPIRLDPEETDRTVQRVGDIIGDILAVPKVGRSRWRYGLTRVLIHMRGLQNMMLDMYDNPGLLHELMTFLRDDFMRELDLFEREGAMALNNTPDHVTGSGGLSPTTSLPADDFSGTVRAVDCVCWGESQETVGVGPEQFEAFVLPYQLPLLKRFGLVDYGCCEPLDQKLDLLLRAIPHLRWVSVSPWADRELCAQKLGKDHVFVYKPNPARICAPQPDWQGAEREIRETIRMAQGCPMHIVMKDTHTFCNEPARITEWCRMAARVVAETA